MRHDIGLGYKWRFNISGHECVVVKDITVSYAPPAWCCLLACDVSSIVDQTIKQVLAVMLAAWWCWAEWRAVHHNCAVSIPPKPQPQPQYGVTMELYWSIIVLRPYSHESHTTRSHDLSWHASIHGIVKLTVDFLFAALSGTITRVVQGVCTVDYWLWHK